MSAVFLKILNMGIAAGWLILAVILVRMLLKKAPKWIICLLWGFVAIRLICPFSLESASSLIPSRETVPAQIAEFQKPVIDSGITIVNETVNPILANSFAPDPADSVNPLQIVIPVISYVWLVGIAALLIYACLSFRKLKKSVSASVSLGKNIMTCDEIKEPFILGVVRPVIYVPSFMERSQETLTYVILHESAHLKRRDHWWKPLGYLLLAIYWFHPLCWIAYLLFCRDIEMACDEKVIRDMDRDHMAAYSQALLDLSFPGKKIAACPLTFGEVSVKQRVKGVFNYKKPTFWILLTAAIVCVLLVLCLMTDPFSERSLSGKLGVSMDMAVAEHHRTEASNDETHFGVTNYDILRVKKSGTGKETTVFATVLFETYSFDGRNLTKVSGSFEPVALTFDTTSDGSDDKSTYDVIEYWEPRDGSYYADDIRSKFPVMLWAKVFNLSGAELQHEKCLQAAREHFGVIGTGKEGVNLTDTDNTGIDTDATDMHVTMTAVIIEIISDSRMLVRSTAASGDLISVPISYLPDSPKPQVGDTVEIECSNQLLLSYPAQFSRIYSMKVVKQATPTVTVTAKTAYANWTEDGLVRTECLNPGIMVVSSEGLFPEGHLPVYKFDTVEDLERFKELFQNILTLDQGYDDVPSFNEVTAAYDEDFFADHAVIAAYVASNSGSYRYALQDILFEGSFFCMDVVQTNNPEVFTEDMAGWFVLAEISDADFKDAAFFDARFLGIAEDNGDVQQ